MSAWWLLAAALAACFAVVVSAARLSPRKEYRGRHLDGPAPVYGSMILAEERELNSWPMHNSRFSALPVECYCAEGGPCACGCHELPDWREQTAADLSPAALDLAEVMPDEPATSDELLLHSVPDRPHVSSGPGVSSLVPPGPAQERLRGPEQPHEKPAGTESAGSGHLTRFPEQANTIPKGPRPGSLDHLAQGTRLADTGDIRDARLLAERIAELRARDDDVQAFMSARAAAHAQARHDLTAALS